MKLLKSLWSRLLGHKPEKPVPVVGIDVGKNETTIVTGERVGDKVRLTDITKWPMLSERQLLPEHERQLFDQLAPEAPEKEIRYPAPSGNETYDWVTERLIKLTGGMTRDPRDANFFNYPTPPTETDLAIRSMVNKGVHGIWGHGYSMRYLGELKRRAEQKDMSLSAEQLMAIRARGIS